MALDQVVLEARARSLVPDTLRFLQFSRPSVLVGYHQRLDQEVRLDFCREQGLEVNRRITGGGAILFEPCHLGWEIVAHRDAPGLGASPQQIVTRVSEIFCQALRGAFGLEAAFRPRNDIEVHGRKISGTGGTQEGGAFLFQGTLLVDLDVWAMLRALRVPMEKLKAHEVDSLMDRVTTLRRELGWVPPMGRIKEAVAAAFADALDCSWEASGLTPWEEARLGELTPGFASAAWIDRKGPGGQHREALRAIHRGSGGVIRLLLEVDGGRRRIRSATLSGDFFSFPTRALYDLESRFKDVPADPFLVDEILGAFFAGGASPFPALGRADFARVFRKALEKMPYLEMGFTHEETHDLFPVGGSLGDVLQRDLGWFLLPYCSKDLACDLRHRDGCRQCGLCSIGEGYAMARETGLAPVTVTSFENLMENLEGIRRRGAGGFIGCCCEGFYTKHAEDLEAAGVPGILVAMDSTTCYDLGKAREAYHGSFDHQTHLNLPLLRKVLSLRGCAP
jgi:lipoate-protein ligase A